MRNNSHERCLMKCILTIPVLPTSLKLRRTGRSLGVVGILLLMPLALNAAPKHKKRKIDPTPITQPEPTRITYIEKLTIITSLINTTTKESICSHENHRIDKKRDSNTSYLRHHLETASEKPIPQTNDELPFIYELSAHPSIYTPDKDKNDTIKMILNTLNAMEVESGQVKNHKLSGTVLENMVVNKTHTLPLDDDEKDSKSPWHNLALEIQFNAQHAEEIVTLEIIDSLK